MGATDLGLSFSTHKYEVLVNTHSLAFCYSNGKCTNINSELEITDQI